MKLFLLYRRRWWLFYFPVLLFAGAAMFWAAGSWQRLPPASIVISAGVQQGSYARIAKRYADELSRLGIQAELVYADSERLALDQLNRPGDATASDVVVGFANGIDAKSYPDVQALAVVGNEPVWVFSSLNGPSSLAQAKGVRIAAGPTDESAFMAAKVMLANLGVNDEVRFNNLTGVAAAEALIDGKVDMVFLTAGEDAQAVQMLTRQGGVTLLGADNAGTLAARHGYFQPLLLPQGAIELRGDVPARDLTLMSLQTHLLVKPNAHPALQRALLDAAFEIHQFPTFLQRHGQFPSVRGSDFNLSPVAKAYSLGERPWLEQLLPYRKAQWVALILFALLPIAGLTLFVLVVIPRLFDWRFRAMLNHFYGELKFLESDMDNVAASNPMALRSLMERLDGIERRVTQINLPDEFSDHWYVLREHLSAAQDHLLKLRAR